MFEDRFAQAAVAIRATALWVALPTAGTHASLCTFYANLMRTILYGSYGDLPTAPPRAEVTRRARTRVVLSVLRTVVVGALPGRPPVAVADFLGTRTGTGRPHAHLRGDRLGCAGAPRVG